MRIIFKTLTFMKTVLCENSSVLCFKLISPVYLSPGCNELPVVLLLQLVGGHVGGDGVVDDHVVQGHVLPCHQLNHLVGSHAAEEGRY